MKRSAVTVIFLILLSVLVACQSDEPEALRPTPTEEQIPWQRPAAPISPDNVVRLRLGGLLNGHTATVFQLAINDNSQRVATIGADKRTVVWNIASGRPVLLAGEVDISDAYFLPNGIHMLTIGADEQLRKWSLNDDQQIGGVQAHELAISATTLSPDGAWIAFGAINGSVTLFDTETLEQFQTFIVQGGGFPVTGIYFSPDGSLLYAASGQGSIKGWSTTRWEQVHQFTSGRPLPLAIATSPDRSLLAVAHPESMTIYDLSSGEAVSTFSIPPFDFITEMQFSRDNAWIAIGGNIDSVTIFEVGSGELVVALRGHGSAFKDLDFSPDRQMILTGIAGGDAYLWNLSDLEASRAASSGSEIQIPRAILQQVENFSLNRLAWSPDGTYIILADRQGGVYLLDVPEG